MNTETIPGYERFCNKCNDTLPGRLDPGVAPHWGKWTCPKGHMVWIPKPDSDPTKYRRENSHRDLVLKYSKGYCEMCLRTDEQVKKRTGETMEAHHILPYQYNGDSSRDNMWIVCTSCHKLIEHARRYVNDPVSVKIMVESILLSIKKTA